MKTNLLRLLLGFCLLLVFFDTKAQRISHEIGITVGPVGFRGDYGESGDPETNLGNTGVGVGISHYFNFAYSSRFRSYFNDHFKVRTQLTYHSTSLEHYGKYVDSDNDQAFKLRAMTGQVNVLEIGTGLEWYFTEIRDFERSYKKLTPYAGFGINAVFANPTNETSLPGRLGSIDNTWPSFLPDGGIGGEPRVSSSSLTTFGVNLQVGAKIKLTDRGEFTLESRWHVYFDDMVEGLNPSAGNNNNDWIFWVGVGYIHYL